MSILDSRVMDLNSSHLQWTVDHPNEANAKCEYNKWKNDEIVIFGNIVPHNMELKQYKKWCIKNN